MRNKHDGAVVGTHDAFEPLDRHDVEVIRGFIQQ